MKRRIRMLALRLIPVFCLGLVNLSFSDDAIRLESWRERAHEGNFAQGIAGGLPHPAPHRRGHARCLPLDFPDRRGELASTHSGQHAIVNFPGVPFLSEDSGNSILSEGSLFLPEDFFDLPTLFNPSRSATNTGYGRGRAGGKLRRRWSISTWTP